jgi:hypothetical protein
MSTTTTQFSRIETAFDYLGYDKEVRNSEHKKELIIQCINDADAFYNVQINDLEAFLDNPIDYVTNLIADNHKELKSLGLTSKKIVEMMDYSFAGFIANVKRFQSVEGSVKIENGKIEIDVNRDIFCSFTNNEKQNSVFKEANTIAKVLNKAKENGISITATHSIAAAIPCLSWCVHTQTFIPNPSYIRLF